MVEEVSALLPWGGGHMATQALYIRGALSLVSAEGRHVG